MEIIIIKRNYLYSYGFSDVWFHVWQTLNTYNQRNVKATQMKWMSSHISRENSVRVDRSNDFDTKYPLFPFLNKLGCNNWKSCKNFYIKKNRNEYIYTSFLLKWSDYLLKNVHQVFHLNLCRSCKLHSSIKIFVRTLYCSKITLSVGLPSDTLFGTIVFSQLKTQYDTSIMRKVYSMMCTIYLCIIL